MLRWFVTSASCRFATGGVFEFENDRLPVFGVHDPALDLGRDAGCERDRLAFSVVEGIEREVGMVARLDERHRFAEVRVGAPFKDKASVDEGEGGAAQVQGFVRDGLVPGFVGRHVDPEHGAVRLPGDGVEFDSIESLDRGDLAAPTIEAQRVVVNVVLLCSAEALSAHEPGFREAFVPVAVAHDFDGVVRELAAFGSGELARDEEGGLVFLEIERHVLKTNDVACDPAVETAVPYVETAVNEDVAPRVSPERRVRDFDTISNHVAARIHGGSEGGRVDRGIVNR